MSTKKEENKSKTPHLSILLLFLIVGTTASYKIRQKNKSYFDSKVLRNVMNIVL